ncbi:MAG TPA: glycosyltransferase family 9 protein [Opitutaceae bacterium]|nr:glycosyltransferase family 9 protein [Opitutaceae bacterium]
MSRYSPPAPAPLFRSWWRRFYWLRRDWKYLASLPWRETALYVGFGGVGDELLSTGLIQGLHAQTGRALDVYCRHPGFFQRNPGVRKILPADPGILAAAETWQRDLRRPCEWQRDIDADRQESPRRHIIAEAAAAGGLRGPLKIRPWLWLTPDELAKAAPAGPAQIAIQSSGAAARFYFRNKEWGSERFQEVVRLLSPRYRFIQLGAAEDPLLDGVVDRRGLADFRQSAALLARSAFFIGQVGFLMHLARAVECRSVIVYGGRELPSQSGYPCNENVTESPPCSPCWQKSLCAYDRICLTRITPARVIDAVERLGLRLGQPLETEEIFL